MRSEKVELSGIDSRGDQPILINWRVVIYIIVMCTFKCVHAHLNT